MRICLLHDAVAAHAGPEAQDTLVQVASVTAALGALGHCVDTVSVTGDLAALRDRLRTTSPALVFNLVESLEGSDAAAVAVPALLDGLGVAYTGSPAAAIAIANDKCAAKALLVRLGLPTAPWFEDSARSSRFAPGRHIVKARFEHASVGLEADAIVELADPAAARRAVATRSRTLGRPCFAERFVDGREFNLSVLDDGHGAIVLPPAEIDFSGFAADAPRLVGYRAKWVTDSFEYQHTPRSFEFDASDAPLLERLRQLALETFAAVGLAGYARVDFRVDADGPWILEANANPCLSPDAGFAAALAQAGIAYPDAIARIVRAAGRRTPMAIVP
jgi:D-alanine-D-alanine ligase